MPFAESGNLGHRVKTGGQKRWAKPVFPLANQGLQYFEKTKGKVNLLEIKGHSASLAGGNTSKRTLFDTPGGQSGGQSGAAVLPQKAPPWFGLAVPWRRLSKEPFC
jgi:hypothetical protein